MKVLIIPDLHLGKSTSLGKEVVGIGLNSRIQDQFNLLDYVYNLIEDNEIDQVVLLGDVFDQVNPKASLVYNFFRWLGKLLQRNVRVISIMGNHDFIRSGQDKLSILDSINTLDLQNCFFIKEIFQETYGDVSFCYIPFVDRKQLEFDNINDATASYCSRIAKQATEMPGKIKIALGHIALQDSIYIGDEIDDESNEIFCPLETFSGYDFSWMGHIHNFQIMQKNPHIGHLGSLDRTAFGEGDKFVVILDTENPTPQYKKLPCRNLNDILIKVPKEYKNSTEYVCSELQKLKFKQLFDSIVRLRIEVESVDAERVDRNVVSKLLEDRSVFYMPFFSEVRELESVAFKTAEIDETITPDKAAEIFVSKIEANDQFKKDVETLCKKTISEISKEQ